MKKTNSETQIHFVGVGGIGMSGIAEVFANQGYRVSGSDQSESDNTRRLAKAGVKVFGGHAAQNVEGANVVVISSAISESNAEVIEARRLRIPVIPRAEMLGELMRGKTGVAIAGSHGKTTTTSILASILTEAKTDPTVVIGGIVNSLGGNAKWGQGDVVVAEADESDGSFLHLPATFGAITNIDNDHLDHFGSLEALDQAFITFIGKLPFYGLAAVCGDDAGVKRCLSRFTKPVVTYGFDEGNDLQVTNLKLQGTRALFDMVDHRKGMTRGGLELGTGGRHNVLNAVAAVAIALDLPVSEEAVRAGLSKFGGVRRRFDVRWRDDRRPAMVVDDYGHHPTEIVATLKMAREMWDGRIISVFQPHRYSRTLHCRPGFASAFRDSDLILVTEIYAAGEEPIDGVSGQELVNEIGKAIRPDQSVLFVPSLEEAEEVILREFKDGDMVMCMGAGTITRLPGQLVAKLNPSGN